MKHEKSPITIIVDTVLLITIFFLLATSYFNKLSNDEKTELKKVKKELEEYKKYSAKIYTLKEKNLKFPSGGYKLSDANKVVLDRQFNEIKHSVLTDTTPYNILMIIGFTDILNLSDRYKKKFNILNNYHLGLMRALSICNYFIDEKKWYEDPKLKKIKLVPSSFGEYLNTGKNPYDSSNWANDRRISFLLMNFRNLEKLRHPK